MIDGPDRIFEAAIRPWPLPTPPTLSGMFCVLGLGHANQDRFERFLWPSHARASRAAPLAFLISVFLLAGRDGRGATWQIPGLYAVHRHPPVLPRPGSLLGPRINNIWPRAPGADG